MCTLVLFLYKFVAFTYHGNNNNNNNNNKKKKKKKKKKKIFLDFCKDGFLVKQNSFTYYKWPKYSIYMDNLYGLKLLTISL